MPCFNVSHVIPQLKLLYVMEVSAKCRAASETKEGFHIISIAATFPKNQGFSDRPRRS